MHIKVVRMVNVGTNWDGTLHDAPGVGSGSLRLKLSFTKLRQLYEAPEAPFHQPLLYKLTIVITADNSQLVIGSLQDR